MYYSRFALAVASVLLLACNGHQTSSHQWTFRSPDGKINVFVKSLNDSVNYTASYVNGTVAVPLLNPSPLGLLAREIDLSRGFVFQSLDSSRINDEYTMASGKRLQNTFEAMEYTLRFANANDLKLDLAFRLFNGGFAYRYQLEGKESKALTISENSGFHFKKGTRAWMQPYDSVTMWSPGYEKYYVNDTPMDVAPQYQRGWAFPILTRVDDVWMLITESNVSANYFGARLVNKGNGLLYSITPPDSAEAKGIGSVIPTSRLPLTTPWRTVMISNRLGDIVESNAVHSLANAPGSKDFSWVKPGRASWSWWGDQGSPRNFEALKKFVDFSKSMSWEYSLIDANWNEMKGGSIEQLAKYANSQGVGLWLWYNSGGRHNTVTEKPRDIMSDSALRKAEFAKLKSWGVKGVKVDFFQSDKPWMIEHYHNILADAAEHQIMVNFHGCTLPRGWSRTWPNLLSMEAVKGAECYIFEGDFPDRAPLHNVNVVFTRNVVGPMDYTPVTLSKNRFHHITTATHELALSVVFESGVMHLADRADVYMSQPAPVVQFLKRLPAAWDDIRFIDGDPSSFVTLARKKGDSWYIGHINGQASRSLNKLDLSFLPQGNYDVDIFEDINGQISYRRASVNTNQSLSIDVPSFGGYVVIANRSK